jgi:hypothetical protein
LETHVVTATLEFSDGGLPPGITCELYRGTADECVELCAKIPGASHDGRQIGGVVVQYGLIADWERYLQFRELC